MPKMAVYAAAPTAHRAELDLANQTFASNQLKHMKAARSATKYL